MTSDSTMQPDEDASTWLVQPHQEALDYDLRRRIVNFLANCKVDTHDLEIKEGVVRFHGTFASDEERAWFAETCYRHGAQRVEIQQPVTNGR